MATATTKVFKFECDRPYAYVGEAKAQFVQGVFVTKEESVAETLRKYAPSIKEVTA